MAEHSWNTSSLVVFKLKIVFQRSPGRKLFTVGAGLIKLSWTVVKKNIKKKRFQGVDTSV